MTLVLCHGRKDRHIDGLDYAKATFLSDDPATQPDICARFPLCSLGKYKQCLIVCCPYSEMVNVVRFSLATGFWSALNESLEIGSYVYIIDGTVGEPSPVPYNFERHMFMIQMGIAVSIQNGQMWQGRDIFFLHIKTPEEFGFNYINNDETPYLVGGSNKGIVLKKFKHVPRSDCSIL